MNCSQVMVAVMSASIIPTLLVTPLLCIPALLGILIRRKSKTLGTIYLCLLLLVTSGAEFWWLSSQQPDTSTQLAVEQLNGTNASSANLRVFESGKSMVLTITGGSSLLAVLVLAGSALGPLARKFSSRSWRQAGSTLSCIVALALLTGCMKPYDRPEYVEIDTSETGFLIPLEGDATQQARFQSEDYLKQRKIATKRVQITHRWSQEGRLSSEGRWIPTVRLVKVNRSPVTRQWSSENVSGSQMRTRNDNAIWIESADSVGFSMGFTCTTFIAEDDAAKFLYWYPSGSLSDVMDHEVRGRIQQVAAEVAAKYPLDKLRARKQEIADAVQKDVTTFFNTRGVTVTTVGMFGGMTYENPEIQKSIDQTFIAQQLKTVSLAKFDAQQKENERLELEAEGIAEKARREASGLGDAKKTAATAEAEAIREVNKALLETQQNPQFLQFKMMEIEKARVEHWDGRYPQYYLGGSESSRSPGLLLPLPSPEGSKSR